MSFQILRLNFLSASSDVFSNDLFSICVSHLFDARKGHLQRASSAQCEISLVERTNPSTHHSEYTQNGMFWPMGEIFALLCMDLCSQAFKNGWS